MVESYRPTSYEEALGLLEKNQVTIIAGGTDLMVKKRSWSNLAPTFEKDVMFVGQLKELAYIKRITDTKTTVADQVQKLVVYI